MEGMFTKVDSNRVTVVLHKEIYEREAVMSAAYRFTDAFGILIRPLGDNEMEVLIEPKREPTPKPLEFTARDFCNEVLDQQVRLFLERRCGRIKELIIEHAFSPLESLQSKDKER